MKTKSILAASIAAIVAPSAFAATDIFFYPLTQSAVVASPNNLVERTSPWLVPAGLAQKNLTDMRKIEATMEQSILRVPGAGTSASMFDMIAYDAGGEYLFIPHETPVGAGVTRYSIEDDHAEVLFSGDLGGLSGDWSNDYAAFDPSLYTPTGTLFLGEEWAGQGRIIEVLNPHAPVAEIQIRELDSIANVSHEGLRFSKDETTLYFVDEWNSGSIYKFVLNEKGNYTSGQTFVLKVNRYEGNAADNWNEASNRNAQRDGWAKWIPLTDAQGNPLTQVNPFRNGPTNDPRFNDDTLGGRPAADELGATPYGRPEDIEVGVLGNGNEVLYFAATSENTVYSVEMLDATNAVVRVAVSEAATPKNLGFPVTTGVLNSPDNLAQDALGNIYVIEDAPNGSATGGDIWFIRDVNNDGVGESLDHFMSIQVSGSEATGMIFNPVIATEFVVAVQHPASTDLSSVPNGIGDALWTFDMSNIVAPTCRSERKDEEQEDTSGVVTCTANTANFIDMVNENAEPYIPWWARFFR